MSSWFDRLFLSCIFIQESKRVVWTSSMANFKQICEYRKNLTSYEEKFEKYTVIDKILGFTCSSVGEESACSAGDLGLIPGLGRFPGEGSGRPLQYSCLENPMDRGAWQATVCEVARVGHDLAIKLLLLDKVV